MEETVQESLLFLSERKFYGPNPLPLPSYIIYTLGLSSSVKISKVLIFFVAFLSKVIIGNLILQKRKGKTILSFIFASLCLYFNPNSYNDNFHFLELFVSMILTASENYLKVAFFLGLAACSDMVGFVFQGIIFARYFLKFFKKLTNPKIKCKDTILEYSKIFLSIVFIPASLFVSALFADLEIRNNHNTVSYKASIPFQSSLKNFNIANGFDNKPANDHNLYTDHYVMDRSVISLVSTYHMSFYNFDEAVKGTASYEDFCEIHKIHNADFEDEEPRFIKNKDLVKLQSIISEAFIGISRDDGDKKFVDLKYGELEDDEDIWEVECDGYLRARESQVKFKNVKTGDYLSVRKIKDQASIFASYYSSHKSRIFYIAGNKNHEYFKTNFEDPRAALEIKDFPKLARFYRLIEFMENLKISFRDLGSSKKVPLKLYFTSVTGTLIVMFLVINQIAKNRYNLCIIFSELTNLISACYITVHLSLIFFGLRLRLIQSLGDCLILSFVADLLDNLSYSSKVYLTSWNKNK